MVIIMKKLSLGTLFLFLSSALLSGCGSIGQKNASLSIIYLALTAISLLLLIGCLLLVRRNKHWFVILFSSVIVVNLGYTLLSVSTSLEMALIANRIAYSGSVFLPMAMLMIIINVTNTKYTRWVPISLLLLSIAVFLLAASPGILDVYYKEVSFEVINGVATLVKVYGPLHPVYLFYLLGYMTAMITIIIRAQVRKTIENAAHAAIIATAVLVNVGVWFIEQLSDINFEILSVSYIISELFLLSAHLVIVENQHLRELVTQKEEALLATQSPSKTNANGEISAEMLDYFTAGLDLLTPTERAIFEAYLQGTTTKDIMRDLNIKENTLKFHNKNLYSKLGVSSRKQLLEVHKAISTEKK